MPDRDADITKFTYFAYRKLKKTLGEFDAIIECNEIAIREFLSNAENKPLQIYINELSNKHSIRVNYIDYDKFSTRIRQYYVASVFQQFEQFLKDFKKEWKQYFSTRDWIQKKDSETELVNTLKNVSLEIESDLITCVDYYRLVRNYMAHSDRDLNKIQSLYNKVQNNSNNFLNSLNISTFPNSLFEINFDDFLILTNVLKHISFLISNNSKPNNKLLSQILLDIAKNDGGKSHKGLKKLKNCPERYNKAIKNFITTEFGRFSKSDLEEVTLQFKSLLA